MWLAAHTAKHFMLSDLPLVKDERYNNFFGSGCMSDLEHTSVFYAGQFTLLISRCFSF